jgi:hypothetical protein
MTPGHFEALQFGLSASLLACLVLAYGSGLIRLPNGKRPQGDRGHAEEKGAALLRSWLSPEQSKMWSSSRKYFHVIGCDTGTRYRIRAGTIMNIDELDCREKAVAQWCFGPQGDLAVGDVMLAQKIALETMELEALAKANRNRRWI